MLVTLDTTRADRLGVYGFEGGTTPRLDEMAQDAVVYTRATSTTSWTLPAHASLFTGKFTSSHGARFDPEGPLLLASAISGHIEWERFRAWGLSETQPRLAGILSEAGYATAGFVAGPWLKRGMGLDTGFEVWDDADIRSERGRLAPGVTDAALAWLRQRDARPFFLFLNYFDPHGPYSPPREFFVPFLPKPPDPVPRRRREQAVNAYYNGEIHFTDHHLGRLLDGLREQGLYDDAWIIVTADHGELMGEHGRFGHGRTLYREALDIPMIVKWPRGEVAPGRSDAPVQLVDVLPSVLDRLGLPLPEGIQGTPLGSGGHPLVAEVYPLPFVAEAQGDARSLVRDGFKYIWRSTGNHELFDLSADPEEARSVAWKLPEIAESMQSELLGYLESLPPPLRDATPHEVDPATQEALRDLGYLE